MSIFLFDKRETDFTTNGLGELHPTECTVTECANGQCDLTLSLPMTEDGKWRRIDRGSVISAPVAVRTMPEIVGISGVPSVVTEMERWRAVQKTAMRNRPGGKSIANLAKNETCLVTLKDGSWYKVRNKKGRAGWTQAVHLAYVEDVVTPPNAAAIENIQPAAYADQQLFRVYRVERGLDRLRAFARHISYDFERNAISECNLAHADGYTALTAMQENLFSQSDFQCFTDIGPDKGARHVDWTRMNPVKALLDPEAGFSALFGAELVRDNFYLYLLNSAGIDRGFTVEYGKNLTGLLWDESEESVVTCVIPVGQTKDGRPLLLPESKIVSPRAAEYPFTSCLILDVPEAKIGGKDASGKVITEARAYEILRETAAAKYAGGIDLPTISLKVDFVNLGDTEAFSAFRELQQVFLFDTIHIRHNRLGVTFAAQVTATQWDALARRYTGIEVGARGLNLATQRMTTWQIPAGVSGQKIAYGTVGAAQIGPEAIATAHIQLAAITTALIEDASITSAKIAKLAVESAHIADATIGSAKIEDASITNAKLANASIRSANIADASITSAKIALLAVENANIRDAAITAAKIADAAITNAKIQNATIDTAKIALGAITTALISKGAVGTAQIADASITDAKIAELTANKITAGTLSVERLIVVGAEKSIVYTINEANGTPQLSVTSLDGGSLTQRSITADRIVAGAITANEIAAATILANNIAAGAITAEKIAAQSIDASKIKAGSITTSELSAQVGEQLNLSSNASVQTTVNNAASGLQSQIDQIPGKITLAVDSMHVGGTNLLKNSAFVTGDFAGWSSYGPNWVCVQGQHLLDFMFGHNFASCDMTAATPDAYQDLWTQKAIVPGKECVLSFYAGGGHGQVYLGEYGASGAAVKYTLLAEPDVPWTSYFSSHIALQPETAKADICFRVWGGNRLNVGLIKLEQGGKATAWSPAPVDSAGSVRSGTTVVIDENQFKVSAAITTFDIPMVDNQGNPTEQTQLKIDESGVEALSVSAPNVMPRYTGPSWISIHVDGGGDFRSLSDAAASLSGRFLPADVTIHMTGGQAMYNPRVTFSGIFGGKITIWGNNCTLHGAMECLGGDALIEVFDLKIACVTGGNALYMFNFRHATFYNCTFDGNGIADRVITVSRACSLGLELCALYNTVNHGVVATENSTLYMTSCRGGNLGNAVFVHIGSMATLNGTRPAGNLVASENGQIWYAGTVVDSGAAPGPAIPATTREYPSVNSGYARGSSWQSGDELRQGYTTSEMTGCFWFDSAAIRAHVGGAAVRAATVRLRRKTGFGSGGNAKLMLYGIANSGKSGAPNRVTSYGLIGVIGNGETKTFGIPAQAANDLVSGSIGGLALYAGDGKTLSGKEYSENYTALDGASGGNRPTLSITYGG